MVGLGVSLTVACATQYPEPLKFVLNRYQLEHVPAITVCGQQTKKPCKCQRCADPSFHLQFVLDRHVIVAWAFLGGVLLANLIIFPLTKFEPRREYGLFLILYYLVFLVVSVLVDRKVI